MIDFADPETQRKNDLRYGLTPAYSNRVEYVHGASLTKTGLIPDRVAARPMPWASGHADQLESILVRLNERDEFLLRQMVDGETQTATASLRGTSQSAISVVTEGAIRRAAVVARVHALVGAKAETHHALDRVLRRAGVRDPVDRLITIAYFWTGSQSEPGRLLGMGQGATYYRLARTRRTLSGSPLGEALDLISASHPPMRTDVWRGPQTVAGRKAKEWCEVEAAILQVVEAKEVAS